MPEFYAGGVQTEPAGGIGAAVEPVSFDRGAESQRVCRVDSQLVGASCQRAEQYLAGGCVLSEGGTVLSPILHRFL